MGLTVDLTLWSLSAAADPTCLSADETARAERFVYDKHRAAYISARSGLRHHLGEITGRDPTDLRFTYGAQGKPSLADGPFFNLSHSGDLACLAVHDTIDLGVDIEVHRFVEDGLAERFFSLTENRALQSLAPEKRVAGFFRCWTRKEAVIKALGGGLSIPLDAFDVTLDADNAALTRLDPAHGQARDWALAAFQIGTDVAGCVAAKTGGDEVLLNIKSQPTNLVIST